MVRSAVIVACMLSSCAREPVASEPSKTAAPGASTPAPSPPTKTDLPRAAAPSTTAPTNPVGPAATGDMLAANLEQLAKSADPATAAKLRAGAEDARAIGDQLEVMDRTQKQVDALRPSIDAMARVMRLLTKRHRHLEDIDADAMVTHEKAVQARLEQLDRELASSPDDADELEDAALDDIMALIGSKRAP